MAWPEGNAWLIPIAVENNADWAETLAEMVKLYKDPNDIWDALKEMGVNPIDKTN